MTKIIQKFGGTSVADAPLMMNAARLVKQEIDQGHDVVVVVSAMAGVTNQLVSYARSFADDLKRKEYAPEHDVVFSSGEQVSCGLMVLALGQLGLDARSFMGWQLPITTDSEHTSAHIKHIETSQIDTCLANKCVPIVAGYQGLSECGRLTTLGRGGSDLTAVALASALKAERCDIYTDVKGVYTADPRIVQDARLLEHVTYEEMFELAAQGAKVLQKRSVGAAWKQDVPVRVTSSFEPGPGTTLVQKLPQDNLRPVTSIALSRNQAKVSLYKVPNPIESRSLIFSALSEAKVDLDMIVQNSSQGEEVDLSLTFQKNDLALGAQVLESLRAKLGFGEMTTRSDIAKLTAVGGGLRHASDAAKVMFSALEQNSIDAELIASSDIKISFICQENAAEQALNVLHKAYDLGNNG